MAQYNTLNVKLTNSQLNKLNCAVKNGTEVTLNVVRDLNDENNFPYKLLLTNIQLWKICKAVANGSSKSMKFSKTHFS